MALLVKQLVTRFATMYRPALASGRFLSIKGVRDCDRGFESRGFNGGCDVRGLTTKISYGLTTRCSCAVATGRFLNVSGVRDCDRGFGFNGCHDVRGFTTKIYNGARTNSFFEVFMNRFKTTRLLSRLFRWGMTASDPSNTYLIAPARVVEDAECLKVHIYMSTSGPEHVRISLDHNAVFVEARSLRRGETFISWFELPDIDSTTKIYKASDIKAVLRVQLGWIELIIPKLKEEEMAYDVDIKTIWKGD